METKRLFIGGLFAGISEADLKDRLGRFGDVSNVELKTRKSADGEPVKTFAHLNLESTPDNFKKCVGTYNGAKWKGSTLSIQVAKESFLERLQKERVAHNQKEKEATASPLVKTPKDIRVPGSKPGDPVPGEENWVVGKFGRALPVVYMRRKDGKKIMKVDPSKYTHSLQVLKDVPAEPADVDELTWEMDEKNSEIEKKKMGVFPAMKKKKKKSVTSSVNADVLREVKEAERSRLEEFEVVSRGRVKAVDVRDDLDSDDTDEIIAMKRPRRDMDETNNRGDMSDSSMETDGTDSDSGVEASRARKGQKCFEKVLHVSQETDEIILTAEPVGGRPARENGIVDNSGGNSDSDASTDIDDILSRIQVKKKVTPKGKRASAAKSLVSSDEENDSVVKAKKLKLGTGVADVFGPVTPSCSGNDDLNDDSRNKIKKKKKSAKKEKVEIFPEKSVAFDGSDEDDLEKVEAFHEPKQGNLSWTKPVKKMKISRKDIVSFDDAGGVVDKLDDADDRDSAGSADTDELFSNMRKKLDTSVAKSQSTPKMSLPLKKKPASKTVGLNVSVFDEFASGLDDVAETRLTSKQKSDFSDSKSEESESNSDSDSETEVVVRGAGVTSSTTKELAGVRTNLNVSGSKIASKSGANSKVKNSSKIAPVSSDSDDDFVSCDSGSDSDSDSSPDAGKNAGCSISKAKALLLKSDSDSSESDEESSDATSDSENIQPSVSQVDFAKTKSSASNEIESDSDEIESDSDKIESDSDKIESDSESADSDSSNSDVQETARNEIVKSEVSNKKLPKKSISESAVSVSSKFNSKVAKQQDTSSDSDSSDSSEAESDTSSEKTAGKEIGNLKKLKEVSESEESGESEASSDAELDNLKSEPQGKKRSILKVSDIVSTGLSRQADSKDTGVQSKKEKKKNKDKTTKNMSKVDKHKSDDLKRMETVQQRRQESQSKKTAIREALAAVDSGKTKGKKIVFSDSDSDDSAADEITHAAEKKSAPGSPSKENTVKAKKAPGLFESDSEEDMEVVDDDEMFRIRPQFEGKAGKKLLRLQRRYGDDERFKMDEKFLESASDDEADENVASQGDAAGERSERERQMDVLKDMFGSRAVDKKVAKKPTFQNASSVHFDPTREDHSQFEVHIEPKKAEKKKKKKVEEAEKKNELELPEVSKERFYEVSTDLKDVFQGKAETSAFSFLTPDSVEREECVDKLASPEPEACQPSSLLPWQAETFNYDTSSGEEEEDERMETEQTQVEPQAEPVNTKLFFFSLDDTRIKEGVESFYRQEDMNVIRQDWWEKRPALIDSYRMRRKRALRKKRHEKVNLPPHQKPKGKWN
ncbi:nucleolar protein 8-like [Lineus longissimus]|uniref:nucleolar protein 8-like n=1 Tax=Lineus longissimus TaxID=88925 RepID=UPI002B4CCC01